MFCVITNANYAKPPLPIVQLVLKTELMNPTSMAVLVLTLQPALRPPMLNPQPMSAKLVTPAALTAKETKTTAPHVLEVFLYLTTSAMSTALETTSNLEGCVFCVITNVSYAKHLPQTVRPVLKMGHMNPTSMVVLV